MRLSIGFTFLLVAIAFVQSKPLFNGVNDINAVLAQLASQNNLANQFNGLAAQITNALSSGQLQTIGQQVFQLAQNVLSGNLDANVAASQFLAEIQQYLGSNTQLFNTVSNIVQQLVNLGGSGLARPAISKQFQVGDLQDVIAQYPQYAGLINQAADLASQVLPLLSPAQLMSLQKLTQDLTDKVLNGKLNVNAAASRLLGQLQSILASNPQLFNAVQSFVQQVVNAAQAILPNFISRFNTRVAFPSPADLLNLANQFKPSDLQGLLAQYPQYAGLINQATSLAGQVASALSQGQLQTLGQQVCQLAQSVFSGQIDANAAASQLFGQLQSILGSNPQLFNAVQSFVQQVVNAAQAVLPNFISRSNTRVAFPSPADLLNLANQFKPSDLQGLLAQYPQYAALINQLTGLAGQVIPTLSLGQLQTLGQQVFQLAQSMFSGQMDVNTAANELLGELQQYFGSNTQLFNAIANAIQQVISLSGAGLTRPAISRQLQLSDLEAIVAQYPEYAALVAPFAALAQQAIVAFSQPQLASLQASVLNLAQNVISGQLDANVAASQLLAEIQQYLGSNTQLYNAIANAVQQLVNLGQGY
ncbi:hypothetical protein I4U23_005810 [Adineta vaga]|nr:hypothetical protein I4U23_005810 [Adineta vaga]